jgi:hypothetical protein
MYECYKSIVDSSGALMNHEAKECRAKSGGGFSKGGKSSKKAESSGRLPASPDGLTIKELKAFATMTSQTLAHHSRKTRDGDGEEA